MISNFIQAGAWVNLKTNMTIGDDHYEEDVVKSPLFMMIRERSKPNLKAIPLDQRLNLMIWYAD